MERQKTKGRKAGLLVDVIMVGVIACTAIVGCAAPARTTGPAETTVTTVTTEAPETVPEATQLEPTATEAPVTLYDVPLSEELQLHIIQESEAHGIDPAVIIAMTWKESTYKVKAMGDKGNSLGLLQIQYKWHKERMERLGCHDLLDPFQNVTVGIDILAGLIARYDGDISMALMAYNAGSNGANAHWFSKGIYSNSYSEAILEKAATLETYQAHL